MSDEHENCDCPKCLGCGEHADGFFDAKSTSARDWLSAAADGLAWQISVGACCGTWLRIGDRSLQLHAKEIGVTLPALGLTPAQLVYVSYSVALTRSESSRRRSASGLVGALVGTLLSETPGKPGDEAKKEN